MLIASVMYHNDVLSLHWPVIINHTDVGKALEYIKTHAQHHVSNIAREAELINQDFLYIYLCDKNGYPVYVTPVKEKGITIYNN
jgi:hypothetical protein